MFCKNITTKALADTTGISYLKTKGSLPEIDKAVKLARVLDISAEFLAEGFENGRIQADHTIQMNAENITFLKKLGRLSHHGMSYARNISAAHWICFNCTLHTFPVP